MCLISPSQACIPQLQLLFHQLLNLILWIDKSLIHFSWLCTPWIIQSLQYNLITAPSLCNTILWSPDLISLLDKRSCSLHFSLPSLPLRCCLGIMWHWSSSSATCLTFHSTGQAFWSDLSWFMTWSVSPLEPWHLGVIYLFLFSVTICRSPLTLQPSELASIFLQTIILNIHPEATCPAHLPPSVIKEDFSNIHFLSGCRTFTQAISPTHVSQVTSPNAFIPAFHPCKILTLIFQCHCDNAVGSLFSCGPVISNGICHSRCPSIKREWQFLCWEKLFENMGQRPDVIPAF